MILRSIGRFLPIVGVLLSFSGWGGLILSSKAAEGDSVRPPSIWFGGGPTFSSATRSNSNIFEATGGITLPFSRDDRQSVRFSISREFNEPDVSRYNLLTHADYRVIGELNVGIHAGAEWIGDNNASQSYLKPIFGIEGFLTIMEVQRCSVLLYSSFAVVGGGTGSLGLNSGPDALSGNFFTIGLILSMNLENKSPARK